MLHILSHRLAYDKVASTWVTIDFIRRRARDASRSHVEVADRNRVFEAGIGLGDARARNPIGSDVIGARLEGLPVNRGYRVGLRQHQNIVVAPPSGSG